MRARSHSLALLVATLALGGCYASHEWPVDAGPMADAPDCEPAARPRCMRRDSPCDLFALVDAECVRLAWQCPAGSQPYESPWTDDRCLPLRDAALFADGVHESPVPVPVGDHCEWIFPRRWASGSSCSECRARRAVRRSGTPIVPIDDRHDADTYVNVESAIATGGETRLLSRAWQFDPSVPFGVRLLGVVLGRVVGERLSFDGPFVFSGGIDLGDAALVDGGFVYAYGHPPDAREADMAVGRAAVESIDDPAAWSVLGTGGWGLGEPVRMFGSGPHRSAVVADPRGAGFLHVYAAGFGDELRMNTAPRPEGPWTDSRLLAPCELPADDPGAYCAGPQVHRELLDPLQPGVLVVSYSIGSTSTDQAERRLRDPDGYWPRIVRLPIP